MHVCRSSSFSLLGSSFSASCRGLRHPAAALHRQGSDGRITRSAQVDLAEVSSSADYSPPIRYLPPAVRSDVDSTVSAAGGAQVLPCFPLGPAAGLPQYFVLQIFEPRYRQMHTDILMSGARRFVVPYILDTEEENDATQLAEVGVVFYLKDLQEVSEETGDMVKYVCEYAAIGRVRIKRLLNPSSLYHHTAYLRVEVEDFVDTDLDADTSKEEADLMAIARQVVDLQGQCGVGNKMFEEPLHVPYVDFNASRSGFWNIVEHWQHFLDSRMELLQENANIMMNERVEVYLNASGGEVIWLAANVAEVYLNASEEDIWAANVANLLEKLSAAKQEELKAELGRIEAELADEINPLSETQTAHIHAIVQMDSHKQRLQQFTRILSEEMKRLRATIALQSVFSYGGV